MPTVSIIIPTHSRPHLLPDAVQSAFAAGTDLEVVVVDDASTDQTAAVCSSLNGIRYVRLDQNEGVAGARNAGIAASSADYIALLDDDDIRLAGSIDLQLAALQKSDAALIYGQAMFGGATDHLTYDRYPLRSPSGDVFWQLLTQNFIPSGSVIVRRSCLMSAGLFDPSLAGIDDWDLWIRLAAEYPVAAVDQPVIVWRRPSPASDQGSAKAVEMVARSTRQFRRYWIKMSRIAAMEPARKQKVARQFSENMASHLVNEAVRSIHYGKLLSANRCVLAALRYHPYGLFSRMARELSMRTRTQSLRSTS